jgi:hypothetical protein
VFRHAQDFLIRIFAVWGVHGDRSYARVKTYRTDIGQCY